MVVFNIFEPASFFGFALWVLLASTHGRGGVDMETTNFSTQLGNGVVTFLRTRVVFLVLLLLLLFSFFFVSLFLSTLRFFSYVA